MNIRDIRFAMKDCIASCENLVLLSLLSIVRLLPDWWLGFR